jgi:hypothetical protein
VKILLLAGVVAVALVAALVQAGGYYEVPQDHLIRATPYQTPANPAVGYARVPVTTDDVWAQQGPLYATPSPYPDVARASNARNCRQWSPRPEDNTCHASDARHASGAR